MTLEFLRELLNQYPQAFGWYTFGLWVVLGFNSIYWVFEKKIANIVSEQNKRLGLQVDPLEFSVPKQVALLVLEVFIIGPWIFPVHMIISVVSVCGIVLIHMGNKDARG